jgi:hypothetical protein
MIRSLMLAIAFASLAFAAEPPAADAVKRAEKTFKDLFGKDYDKASKSKNPAEKVAFAKKLWDTAVGTPNDPSIAYVFGEKAYPLAMSDPSGYAIALEIKQARVEASGKNRPGQLAAVAEVLEKMLKVAPPEKRAKLLMRVVDAYRDQAEASFSAGRESEMAAALAKAKDFSKGLPPAEALAIAKELAAEKDFCEALRKHQNDVKVNRKLLAANAEDAKGHAGLALALIRTGDAKAALVHLKGSAGDALTKLAEALEKPGDDPLTIGDAWRSAAEAHPAEKAYLLGMARRAYSAAAEAAPMHANAGRAKLIARELPPFRPVTVRVPSASFVLEVLDEPETGEAVIAPWAKAAKAEFTRAEKFSGEACLKLPPGKHGGACQYAAATGPNPNLGEYRFVRFAWKQTGGSFCQITFLSKLHALNSYAAGKPPPDPHVKVAEAIPAKWTMLTRDLYTDRLGNYQGDPKLHVFDGLRIESDGELLLDGVWLGRSAKDLDRLTPRVLE